MAADPRALTKFALTVPLKVGGVAARGAWRLAGQLLDRRRAGEETSSRPERPERPTTAAAPARPAGPAHAAPDGPPPPPRPEPRLRDRRDDPPAARPASPPPPPQAVPEPEPDELVAEFADPGAEDGAGANLRVEAPWKGYDDMTAATIADRLVACDAATIAAVQLYEGVNRKRRTVLAAAESQLAKTT